MSHAQAPKHPSAADLHWQFSHGRLMAEQRGWTEIARTLEVASEMLLLIEPVSKEPQMDHAASVPTATQAMTLHG